MQRKTKIAVTTVLVVAAMLVSPYVYSLLTAQKTVSNTLWIKGVGIDVLTFIDDTTPPTVSIASHDWGKAEKSTVIYFTGICLKNIGTENLTLAFTNTLNATVGTIRWEIEQMNIAEVWQWQDWASLIATNGIVGSNSNPMTSGQVLGMRPATSAAGNLGHIRIVLTIDANAPQGQVAPFGITVAGTEKV